MILQVNGAEYDAQITGKELDRAWDGRASKTITLAMGYAQAAAIFTDGLAWSCEDRADGAVRHFDCSDYTVAGDITDHRNGTVTVKMGKKTDAEKQLETAADAEQTAKTILGMDTYTAVGAQKAEALRYAIETASASLDDRTASEATELFPQLAGEGSLVKSGTRINWNGTLKRAAVDLWDTAENTPDAAPALWEDIQYKTGYRLIPETITATLAFAKGERGWWQDALYESLLDANVWTPAVNPDGWKKIDT